MSTAAAKIRFDKSGYYFIGLIALVLAGFWRSYFYRFFAGTNNYSFYFHFHAVMMSLWVVILIVQPLLIRKKKLALHRLIGKASYVIMPVLLISVVLILNAGQKALPKDQQVFSNIIFPVRDLFILAAAFTIGTLYRRDINIHARAMVVTGIVFVEPTLARFLGHLWGQVGGLITMVTVLAIFITLIVIERKQKKARWIFPSVMALFVIVYTLLILQVNMSVFDPFVRWFAGLPLT
ncbi:MAG: hypothetical protein EOP51_15560 [Sphingobacteriales bacterium]|nr:MAG: hypothetical protein EOP51_15560 [Sphingobacteriales bacterium]